ncbi:MAG: hypothetical protein JWR80_10022 [Bradyrhizobium sp.]|nr:hypothetical protein [Bradyrhizobium sp.]
MGIKGTIFLSALGGILSTMAIALIILASYTKEGAFVFLALMCAFVATGTLMGACNNANELRSYVPDVTRSELLASIPPDAIDRRWVKEIESAFSMYYPSQIWDGADALMRAHFQTEQAHNRQRVNDLISAARSAGGVRLPTQVTVRD